MPTPTLAFIGGDEATRTELTKRYGHTNEKNADTLIVLGGDGFMLQTLHRLLTWNTPPPPVYGMNTGTNGFLLNAYEPKNLTTQLKRAHKATLTPLHMLTESPTGTQEALAFNEVVVGRQTPQAAHVRIEVNGKVRLEKLVCDGIMLATPAGSTAYNFSANGPILPLRSKLLALTPVCAFRPRRWQGALLPSTAKVTITALNTHKRTVSATADHHEVRNIHTVHIQERRDKTLTLLFAHGGSLEERILREQFTP